MRLLARATPAFWLLLTTALVGAAFLGATLYSNHLAGGIDRMAEDIAGNAVPSIRYLDDARTQLHAMVVLVRDGLSDTARARVDDRAVEAHRRRLQDDLDAYVALPWFPGERERWLKAEQDLLAAERDMDAELSRLDAGDSLRSLRQGLLGFADAADRADAALGDLIAFDADEGSGLSEGIQRARRATAQFAFGSDALVVVLAVGLLAVAGRASRQYVRALERARDAEGAMTGKLEAVARAALAIADAVPRRDLRGVLQVVVDSARAVSGAEMAALGMGGSASRPFEPFVCSGLEPGIAERLGPPRAVGLLAALPEGGISLRLDAAPADPRSGALPPGHPPVGPLLAAAIRHEGERVGNVYLARRPGAAPFDDQEARAVELLAAFAGTAVQNVRLYEALRREVMSREDLLSMVSHDLRNPLSAIALAARALRRSTPEGGGSSGGRHVDVIVRNARRMERMIDDLLTAAKVQEGKLTVEPRAQDAAAIVREAVDAFAAAAADTRIDLALELSGELPPVWGDAGRLVQVLSNLIGNALKFTPPGGRVTVGADARGADRGGGEVVFSVRDTGVGISEEAAAHVFERFWQTHDQSARGTGLGLFIAKGIVESHGGRIWVRSRPGEGSDFRFTVPVVDAAFTAPDWDRAEAPRTH